MKSRALQLVVVVTSLLPPCMLIAQTNEPAQHHGHFWTETDDETLWRVQYKNCDYGFFVKLGPGIVAHGTHSPSPNHGFLLPLPDTGRISFASSQEDRIIWVDASYDVAEDQSLPAAADEMIALTRESNRIITVAERKRFVLSGRPAIWVRQDSKGPNGTMVEESVVAVHSGIVYTVRLRSDLNGLSADEAQFKLIINGFRLVKLPQGECSND